MALRDTFHTLRDRLAAATRRSGRSDDSVTLVAVSKTRSAADVDAAIEAGVTVLGENRVQEAEEKKALVTGSASWHLVGHLQRNKVKTALGLFDLIHSVDSVRLARAIGTHAPDGGYPVLVQVNVSGEGSKFGFEPGEAVDRIAEIGEIPGVRVEGLMTIGLMDPDPEQVRPGFQALRKLFDDLSSAGLSGVEMTHLSMGMTNDFEVAIEEGATMVRIGTALFGPRESA